MTKAKALTEEQWRSLGEPYRLLRHLQQHCLVSRMRGGKRRQRLAVCASARLAWHLLEEQEQKIVVVAERAADGLTTRTELAAARKEANTIVAARVAAAQQAVHKTSDYLSQPPHMKLMLAYAVEATTSNSFSGSAATTAASVVSALGVWEHMQGRQANLDIERHRHADLIRDIFRDPFREPAPFDRTTLAPKGAAVERIARTIYDEYRWDELPVLADALEEAGCADADLLAHCRATTPHARGCWAVDLVLGIT